LAHLPIEFALEGEKPFRAGPDFDGETFWLTTEKFARPFKGFCVVFAFQYIKGLNRAQTICEIERIRSHLVLSVADRRPLLAIPLLYTALWPLSVEYLIYYLSSAPG
jgi:hypothetical protein